MWWRRGTVSRSEDDSKGNGTVPTANEAVIGAENPASTRTSAASRYGFGALDRCPTNQSNYYRIPVTMG